MRSSEPGVTVILVPNRNLRDSILEGPEFRNFAFTPDQLGVTVVWLGRPVDGSKLGVWEDRIAALIDEKLASSIDALQQYEVLELWSRFRKMEHFAADIEALEDETNILMLDFRFAATVHMEKVFELKRRRHVEFEALFKPGDGRLLVVSTLDAFV